MKCFADENEVILDATCESKGKSRLFAIKKEFSYKDDIIDSMNKAFGDLEKELIEDLGK